MQNCLPFEILAAVLLIATSSILRPAAPAASSQTSSASHRSHSTARTMTHLPGARG